MNSSVLVTQSGLDSLKTNLIQMQNKRPQIVERLSIARSMGDLSENSDYINAREELDFLDSGVAELEELIKNSQVVLPSQSSTISFGHTVTVQVNSTKTSFQIVGEPEASPKDRKISHQSPLGQALMGKKVGDQVEVEAPVGKISYQIVAIS